LHHPQFLYNGIFLLLIFQNFSYVLQRFFFYMNKYFKLF
jgi:hypothetical protein